MTGVAVDVRRLIRQVEKGQPFDLEWTGHAYDVSGNVTHALHDRLGHGHSLAEEIEKRIDHFARSSASANMYLRLMITDALPDLPEYNPCQISVYDGVQDSGTDFSQVVQRSTIYGTVMTSVNITDLRAYFESGRKRQLVVYMGTDRQGDMKALGHMIQQLPAMLEAAGFDKKAIADIIAMIKAGNLPPAAMKALQQVIEIAQIKTMIALNPDAAFQLQDRLNTLQAELGRVSASLTAGSSVPALLLRAVTAIAATPASRFSAFAPAILKIAPHALRSEGLKALEAMVKSVRGAARDKTVPVDLRREMAQFLRSVRTGVAKNMAQPRQLPLALSQFVKHIAPLAVLPSAPAALKAVIPAAVAAVAALATPAYSATVLRPAVVAAVKADTSLTLAVANRVERLATSPDPVLPIKLLARAPQVIDALPAQQMAKILATIKPTDLALPVVASTKVSVANDTGKPATENRDTIKRNADGTVMDCCKPKFNEQVSKGVIDVRSKADVAAILGQEIAEKVTVAEAKAFIRDTVYATALMNSSPLKLADTNDSSMAAAIARIESQKQDSKPDHICGAFCDHAKAAPKKFETTESLKIATEKPRDAAAIKAMKFEL